MKRLLLNIIGLAGLVYLIPMSKVYAVLPPDVLFNIGSQFVQIFSIVLLSVGAVFASGFSFFKMYFDQMKIKPWIIVLIIVVLVWISLAAAYFIDQRRQSLSNPAAKNLILVS